MSTTTITIQVDTAAAKAFAGAFTEEQRKIQLLLSLRLQDLTDSGEVAPNRHGRDRCQH